MTLEKNTDHIGPKEAAAQLVALKLESYGVVYRAENDSNLVRCWVGPSGVNLTNLADNWNYTIGEIGPVSAYNDEIQALAPEGAETYFNMIVDGVADEPTGYTLPTFAPMKDGVKRRDPDDLDPMVRRLCEIAGVPGIDEK